MSRFPPPIGLTVRSTHFGTAAPLPQTDVRTMMVLVIQYASYRSARGFRKIDVKERQMIDKLEIAAFAVLCLAVEVVLVSGLCPLH